MPVNNAPVPSSESPAQAIPPRSEQEEEEEEEEDLDDLDLDLDFGDGDLNEDGAQNGGFMMGSSQGGRENKTMRPKPPAPPHRTPTKGIGVKSGSMSGAGDDHTQFMVINTAANRYVD